MVVENFSEPSQGCNNKKEMKIDLEKGHHIILVPVTVLPLQYYVAIRQ